MKKMKSVKNIFLSACVLLAITGTSSCKKFSVLNTNPNGISSSSSSPDYLMAGVLTSTAKWYGTLGSGDVSGVMQQTYEDAFGSTFSDNEWDAGDFDWTGNYETLTNNKLLLTEAQAAKWDFHTGVALVMRAFNFGNIADFWGSAPDSMALSGDQGGSYDLPAFEQQQNIYVGVIADLKAALPYFNGTMADHPEITSVTQTSDVLYNGNPVEWKRFTYSLLLRYYLRLSVKENEQTNVEAIADSVFQSTSDDCMMPFPGTDAASSYQFCSEFNGATGFNRNKMCGTMTMTLKALQDPRVVIMAQPIVTPTEVSAAAFSAGDDTTLTVIAGTVRYLNPAAAAADNYKQYDLSTYAQDRPYGAATTATKNLYDTSSVYVGIPPAYSGYPDFQYNLNESGQQATSLNNYVSYLREDIYNNPSGTLLAERLASYSEICFDLAEAALKGWNVGQTASAWYYAGIQASFTTWDVFSGYQSDVNNYYGCVKSYNAYIAQPAVAYNGTLSQIMTQKWIAAWQACNEAFMDWRRTGYPVLAVGWASYRGQIPVRFGYNDSELADNSANAQVAINALVTTAYNGTDGANSSWSKFWLLQGTGEPW